MKDFRTDGVNPADPALHPAPVRAVPAEAVGPAGGPGAQDGAARTAGARGAADGIRAGAAGGGARGSEAGGARTADAADEVDEVDVVVVGAGQAGLSAAYHLRRTGGEPGRDFVVLDRSPAPGGAWQHRWPSLTYGKVHGLHDLPGLPLGDAPADRPSSEVIGGYFARYEEEFGLRVRRPVEVLSVSEGGGGRLLVRTTAGDWSARALINATGTWERPFIPHYPGAETFRGRQVHTAGYRGPADFAGERVVVVGGGTSAVQHLLEVSEVAASTLWVTRRPPVFHEGPFDERLGREAVARVDERVRAGLPPRSVVSVTGLLMNEEVRRGRESGVLVRRPMFARLTPDGVAWKDGRTAVADTILWATGFRAALDHLAPLRLREKGGGIHVEGTRVVRDPRIHLVGYGPSASTVGANRYGRVAAREVRRLPAPGTAAA
ncbi:FAD-dependent oxidoreductase [Streptomyces zingiberis]|uniref:FAD-dependent oxidoreductase n=1 Tax=Streptomyces zingiberis TaxID=2053010 RepID=A0ABX1BUK9_9ACTN|nr:FAD-dependent oxidoreductase [Streptomyces zingiberis]NJQ00133.1 FAD-dependent oxidoreductase [Streptomyces zingiberis]